MENINQELAKLPTLDAIYPLLDKEARSKNLQIFIFDYEELKEHFTPKYEEVAVVTISKNKDTALWNIKNFRHSYLIRLSNTDAEALNKV
jgi:hypothetical protein